MPCMQVDVDDLLDDPELERLHAERLAAMQAGRSTEPCRASRTCVARCARLWRRSQCAAGKLPA